MKKTTQIGYKEMVRESRKDSYTIVIQDSYNEYRCKTYTRAWINRRYKGTEAGRTEGIRFINKLKQENPNKFIFAFYKDPTGKIHKANIEEVEWW